MPAVVITCVRLLACTATGPTPGIGSVVMAWARTLSSVYVSPNVAARCLATCVLKPTYDSSTRNVELLTASTNPSRCSISSERIRRQHEAFDPAPACQPASVELWDALFLVKHADHRRERQFHGLGIHGLEADADERLVRVGDVPDVIWAFQA